MLYCKEILICILIIILLSYISNNQTKLENFKNNINQPYTKDEMSIALRYGAKRPIIRNSKKSSIMGPSSNIGHQKNYGNDTVDSRGYDLTTVGNGYNVDVKTSMMNDVVLRNKFQNMYMLDPEGAVSQYDVTNMPVSKHCCPAQYSVPFMGDDNCSFAKKYVANNYMSMNYNSEGNGCPCMTPEQAEFYTIRGGNTSSA